MGVMGESDSGHLGPGVREQVELVTFGHQGRNGEVFSIIVHVLGVLGVLQSGLEVLQSTVLAGDRNKAGAQGKRH